MYAFILVIKAIVGAGCGPSAKKADHIVLVQLCHAAIFLGVLVVIVKFAGVAIRCDRFLLVFHKIPPIQSVCPIIISKSDALGKRISAFPHIYANPKQAGKKPSAKCASALHVEKALDVTVTDVPSHPYGKIGAVTAHADGCERTLCECELFKVYHMDLNGKKHAKSNTVSALLMLEGQVSLGYADGEIKLSKGDSVLIPKDCEVTLHGKGQIIYTIA